MEFNYQDILDFWFGNIEDPSDEHKARWFYSTAGFDAEVKKCFSKAFQAAAAGDLDSWVEKPESSLALIILLDQFSRNIFRNSKEAFAQDQKARGILKQGLERQFDQQLPAHGRMFYYLPFEHSESMEDQKEALRLFRALADSQEGSRKEEFENVYDFAKRHFDVVDRFGRFPHRNEVIGRASSAEELDYLRKYPTGF